MKKTTFVALLLLSAQCVAKELTASLADIEAQWAKIYYQTAKANQAKAYQVLLNHTLALNQQYPKAPELLFWQAVIKATAAEQQDGLSALKSVTEAKDLLLTAIKLKPSTMDGSAYVTLGTLYGHVPGWPVAFGDNQKARQMFEAALNINPKAVDAHYFYGEFLANNNELKAAREHFTLANHVTSTNYTDSKLQEAANLALKNIDNHQANSVKKLFLSLLSQSKAK
jgi:tetratricopeptide (TPR) repeat protein